MDLFCPLGFGYSGSAVEESEGKHTREATCPASGMPKYTDLLEMCKMPKYRDLLEMCKMCLVHSATVLFVSMNHDLLIFQQILSNTQFPLDLSRKHNATIKVCTKDFMRKGSVLLSKF